MSDLKKAFDDGMNESLQRHTPENEPSNLRHWSELLATDPRQTKPFTRAGGFKGTAIDTTWRIMRLTEHFGPCGTGWGMDEPRFHTMDSGDETLVYCTLRCWYKDTPEAEPSYIWGVGGDKVASRRTGSIFVDDEAFKKAFTDAIMNAFVKVGLSADIWLGLHSDSKYLVAARERFDNSRAILQQIPQTNPSIKSGT